MFKTIRRYRNMSPRWGFCVVVSAIIYKHSAPNGAVRPSTPPREGSCLWKPWNLSKNAERKNPFL
jgi:hypothetical protein